MQPFDLSLPPFRGHFHPKLDRESAEQWLRSAADLVPSTEAKRWRGPSPCGELFVKYRESSLLGRLRHPRGGSFAQGMQLGMDLEKQGILTSPPLAHLQGPGRKGTGHWLLMKFISGLELGQAVATQEVAQRADLFHRLALAVARLHDAGFRQRDLKAPNIMVRTDGAIALVDLEGMRSLPGPATVPMRIKDLARLAASFQSAPFKSAGVVTSDWDALLAAYCDGTETPDLRPKMLAVQIQSLAQAKILRNAQKGRPLA